jgi:hypothetical protein
MNKILKGKYVLILISFALLSSCGEGTNNTATNNNEESYSEYAYGYLLGEEVSFWEHAGGKSNALSTEPLVKLKNPPLLKVVVKKQISNNILVNLYPSSYQHKSGWLRVQYNEESKIHEGFVDIRYVYQDPKGKILFASIDSTDQSINIFPANYSTSMHLSLRKKGYENKYRKRVCSTLDSALVLHQINNEKRGEFETEEEFIDRKKIIKAVANATKWNEKVYTGVESISGDAFSYDVDNQIMTIEAFSSYNTADPILKSDSYSQRTKTSNWIGIKFNMEGSLRRYCDPLSVNEGFIFNVDRKSFGNFKFELTDGSFLPKASAKIKIKMDTQTAKNVKESAEYKIIYGIKPSKIISARQWTETWQRSNGTRGSLDSGKFSFDGEVLYMFLVNQQGRLVESYTTEEYISNYLDNDLYIQTYASSNNNTLPEIENLPDKEKIAKLFWNKINLFGDGY